MLHEYQLSDKYGCAPSYLPLQLSSQEKMSNLNLKLQLRFREAERLARSIPGSFYKAVCISGTWRNLFKYRFPVFLHPEIIIQRAQEGGLGISS